MGDMLWIIASVGSAEGAMYIVSAQVVSGKLKVPQRKVLSVG